jgi:replication-associated recombination protein RarA
LNHVFAIGQLIKSIAKSNANHAIIIEGPPGWGKTTTVDQALVETKVPAVHLGAYSTPLNLFNFLFENSDKLTLITRQQRALSRRTQAFHCMQGLPPKPMSVIASKKFAAI